LNSVDMPRARNLTYRDCQWPGLGSSNWPPGVQISKSIVFDHCRIQGGGDIAIDKCIERLVFRDCDLVGVANTLLFQSSSVRQLVIESTTLLTLQGTPRNTSIRSSSIVSLTPTPRSNGVMESLDIEDSYIGSMSFQGFGNGFGGAEPISNYTFANGTFSRANSGGASHIPWACPGAKCIFQDTADAGFVRSPPSFTVLAVRGDGGAPGTGNVHVDTTLTTIPTWTQGTAPDANFLPTLIVQHIYPRISIRNCRGSSLVMNWQNPVSDNLVRDGGVGFQYAQLMLTGNVSGVTGNSNMHAEGTITKININVLRAYTGANATEAMNCTGFQIYGLTFAGTAGLTFSVDVKTGGLRTWTAGSWVGSVGADSLPAIVNGAWLWGYLEWDFNNSMVADTLVQTPIVIVEIFTDVGIIRYPWIDFAHALIAS
jgi:hypothetical protein